MNLDNQQIGIKQILRLEWLDYAASLRAQGYDNKDVKAILSDYVKCKSGTGGDKTRGKFATSQIVNMIYKIWFKPIKQIDGFRQTALGYYINSPSSKVAVNWAVLSVAYPFWINVGRQIGRLLNLQGSITKKQIILRIIEQYGDRETVRRYARYTIRSYVAWGLLNDKGSGEYYSGEKVIIDGPAELAILFESILLSKQQPIHLKALSNDPCLFCFQFPETSRYDLFSDSPRMELIPSIEDDIVKLRIG